MKKERGEVGGSKRRETKARAGVAAEVVGSRPVVARRSGGGGVTKRLGNRELSAEARAERVRWVYERLVRGQSVVEIRQAWLAEWLDEEWPVEPFLEAAGAELAGMARGGRQRILGFCLEATRAIFAEAMEFGGPQGLDLALKSVRALEQMSRGLGEAEQQAEPAPVDSTVVELEGLCHRARAN